MMFSTISPGQALEAGEELKVVSEQLGHANFGTTADLYAHVAEKLRSQSANRTASCIIGEQWAASR